jgi:hypothetical protein
VFEKRNKEMRDSRVREEGRTREREMYCGGAGRKEWGNRTIIQT